MNNAAPSGLDPLEHPSLPVAEMHLGLGAGYLANSVAVVRRLIQLGSSRICLLKDMDLVVAGSLDDDLSSDFEDEKARA
jgi:hypothetical protein